jgi:hypothetical protein
MLAGDTLVPFAAGQTRRMVFDTRMIVPGWQDVPPGVYSLEAGFSSQVAVLIQLTVVP